MPRWTERERTALIDDLRDQIELVWMTGELHLEKPTVQHEVSPRASLLRRGAVREGAGDAGADRRRARALLPGQQFRAAALLPVRLVDRRRPRRQSLGHAPTSPAGRCGRTRSPRCATTASRIVDLAQGAVHHRARAAGAARLPGRACARAWRQRRGRRRSRTRNPGEPYRQYLSIVLRKLDATIARVEGMDIGGPGAAYANADELIHDLRVIEQALQEANSPSLAANLVKPVRRAVEIFRFSTVQARSPREHHQDHRGASGAVVGDRRPRRRQPARARQPRMAGVAVPRAGAAA